MRKLATYGCQKRVEIVQKWAKMIQNAFKLFETAQKLNKMLWKGVEIVQKWAKMIKNAFELFETAQKWDKNALNCLNVS